VPERAEGDHRYRMARTSEDDLLAAREAAMTGMAEV
jgi:hypothetical protein